MSMSVACVSVAFCALFVLISAKAFLAVKDPKQSENANESSLDNLIEEPKLKVWKIENLGVERLKTYREEFRKQKKLINEFKCKDPKPTVYSWRELIPEEVKGQNVLPHFTVINRCNNRCGWCKDSESRCSVSDLGNKTLIFQIILPYSTKFIKVEVEEHKTCSCQSTSTSKDIK